MTAATSPTAELLRRIDRYLDAVPRTATDAVAMGPLTLFVNGGGGWRYYARPTLGATTFSAPDVSAVVSRQAALGQPQELEWIVEVTPGLGPAAAAAGLEVVERPLLYLPENAQVAAATPDDALLRMASVDDDLATLTAVAQLGFGASGTAVGPVGAEALAGAAREVDAAMLDFVRPRMQRGLTFTAFASLDGAPVATGSHQPMGGVSELVGIACLPLYRRRGLGAAITRLLAEDARARGSSIVFLSAGDEDVARIYERVGFRRIARVGAAAPRS